MDGEEPPPPAATQQSRRTPPTFPPANGFWVPAAALSALVLLGVRLPAPSSEELSGGRPLGIIARQPLFITAVICGAVSYMVMNFLMTAAPLAMHLHGHSQESSNLGLQWHVIAMYAPSFITGWLINRFGAGRIVATGLLLSALSAAAGLTGASVSHFWLTLVLLGIGWNFGFIGASSLVLECHRPEEKTRAQSLNDFIIFGTMAIGSFASGGLLAVYDWSTVLWVSLLPLGVAVVALTLAASLSPQAANGPLWKNRMPLRLKKKLTLAAWRRQQF